MNELENDQEEADKMIDMGFEEDVNYILDSIKS